MNSGTYRCCAAGICKTSLVGAGAGNENQGNENSEKRPGHFSHVILSVEKRRGCNGFGVLRPFWQQYTLVRAHGLTGRFSSASPGSVRVAGVGSVEFAQ